MLTAEVVEGKSAAVRFSDIRLARNLAFQSHQTDRWGYGIDRGAFGNDPIVAYEGNLPRFRDNSTYGWIDLLTALRELKAQAQVEEGKVRVLDIGCGTGRFGRDIERKPSDPFEIVGISAFDWRNNKQRREDERRGITYLIHDAQRLVTLHQEEFDCVVSVKALCYMADPLTVLKGAYCVTRVGGFGFLNFDAWNKYLPEDDDTKKLTDYLKAEHGFQINSRGIAYRRNEKKLVLPVKYTSYQTSNQYNHWVTYKVI